MDFYKALAKQDFKKGDYKLVPIRFQDCMKIMKLLR